MRFRASTQVTQFRPSRRTGCRDPVEGTQIVSGGQSSAEGHPGSAPCSSKPARPRRGAQTWRSRQLPHGPCSTQLAGVWVSPFSARRCSADATTSPPSGSETSRPPRTSPLYGDPARDPPFGGCWPSSTPPSASRPPAHSCQARLCFPRREGRQVARTGQLLGIGAKLERPTARGRTRGECGSEGPRRAPLLRELCSPCRCFPRPRAAE